MKGRECYSWGRIRCGQGNRGTKVSCVSRKSENWASGVGLRGWRWDLRGICERTTVYNAGTWFQPGAPPEGPRGS